MAMRRAFPIVLAMLLSSGWLLAQVERLPASDKAPPKSQPTPRSAERTREAGESSSKNTQIDISPPKDDDKNHPDSASAVADAQGEGSDDVQEMRNWDPHRATKNIEVGDYYFKRKNYRAALDRYQEALEYKPNDAEANFHMAQCLEKLGKPDEAADHYQEYLKIMPHGPFAPLAQKALEGLKVSEEKDPSADKNQPK